MKRRFPLLGLVMALLGTAACDDPTGPKRDGPFEVWLVDQSNTTGTTYGGAIYVYEGAALVGSGTSSAAPIARIDLAGATAALCLAQTGANPVRPHMILFNSTGSHAILSFVASGHVVVYDADTRLPVSCIRTAPGAGGARQAHAAFPSPDDSYIIVANQNGKLLERIDTNYATRTFTYNAAATLNLATCTTPSGRPCESAQLRPDNAPICPIIESRGSFSYVTLRGGGLLVVDARQTPMRIVAEYDSATVKGNGCGGVEGGGGMYINSGGGTPANLHQFDLYRFPVTGFTAGSQPNQPARATIFSASGERDSHGMAVTRNDRFLWVMDRAANVAEVFSIGSGQRVNTVTLAGSLSADPGPDLVDVSPSGRHMFVSLRGPNPLSGDPHVSTGTTPGLGVIELSENGRSGTMTSVVRISNVDGNNVERADAHGIRVRVRR